LIPQFRQGAFITLRATLRALGVPEAQALLLLGHMRCGSTLLTHLLLTQPGIVGCGERNTPIRDARDLDRLELAGRLRQRALLRHVRYAVDQINHDHLIPVPALLASPRVRCVFLIREPGPAIGSILELTRRFYEPWDAAGAAAYYASRLRCLVQLAEAIGQDRFVALTYDDLVIRTRTAFCRLESFLGLDVPLRESYMLQSFTGTRGDPTEKIRTGRIRQDGAAASLDLPELRREDVTAAVRACSTALRIGG
jgi:hypothetical protein